MSFDGLGLSPELLRAVSDEGYTEPTPVQAAAIPVILEGRDEAADRSEHVDPQSNGAAGWARCVPSRIAPTGAEVQSGWSVRARRCTIRVGSGPT